MPKFTKLRATQGADEANHDGVKYRVDNEGTITVPTEVVPQFTGVAGFVQAEPEVLEVPMDRVRMIHDDATGCGWRGMSFEQKEDGSFHVPAAAAAELASHGFVMAAAVAESPEAAEPKSTIPKLKTPEG